MHRSSDNGKDVHKTARLDQGVNTAFQRPHAGRSAVHQDACDTHRTDSIGSTAIDHHIAVRWYAGQRGGRIIQIDRHRRQRTRHQHFPAERAAKGKTTRDDIVSRCGKHSIHSDHMDGCTPRLTCNRDGALMRQIRCSCLAGWTAHCAPVKPGRSVRSRRDLDGMPLAGDIGIGNGNHKQRKQRADGHAADHHPADGRA